MSLKIFGKQSFPKLFGRSYQMGHPQSQNHRIVGVERNLCGSSNPTLLPKHVLICLVTPLNFFFQYYVV